MTTRTEKAKTEPKKSAKSVKEPESVYSAKELAENHKVFGTSYEIVDVSLRLAGKKTATLKEAQKIVNDFKNKEVK